MKRISHVLLIVFIVVCALSLVGCSQKKASVPENVTIDEQNNLIWDEIADVKSYVITFFYVDKNETTQIETRKAKHSLDELIEGDYQITVRSVSSEKRIKDSDESEILYYHKYKETGCVYTLIKNDTEYAITKVGKATGTFVIEDYYRGKAVTEIAARAFKGSMNVVDITIGNNVISIGESAFWNCTKLERVFIPPSVSVIGEKAFQSCRQLKEINIPSSIREIPDFCFAYCKSITSIIIPDSVEKIGDSAFIDCAELKNIVIPDSVYELGSSEFSNCYKLESATIGSKIRELKDSVFYNCQALKTVTFSQNSSLKKIGNDCFGFCESLKSLIIPNGVESFGNRCFKESASLESITIPPTVKSIGSSSFVNTKILNDGIASNDDFVYADNWLIYASYDVSLTLDEITQTTFKQETIGIGERAFSRFENLKIITFSTSIKYIGNAAFYNCTSLWKLRIPEGSVETIGDSSFRECALTNISLGEGLKRIGNFAFSGNLMLDNNELNPYELIPESVESIGQNAFYDTKLYNKTKDEESDGIVYAGNWAVGVSKAVDYVDLELRFDTERVAGIADYAFAQAENEYNWMKVEGGFYSVSGLVNCKYIGVGAFYGNINLSSISLNRNLTEIREATFYDTGIVMVSFPRSLKKIGDYAFSKSNITNLDLSSTSIETIGHGAFHSIRNLSSLIIGESVEYIGDYAFFDCVNLKNIVIPENVTYLGEDAFCRCLGLETVEISSNISKLENSLFANCLRLKSVTLPDSIKEIGKEAFFKCQSLEDINLGSNVQIIDEAAFYENTSLKSIILPSSIERINIFAFNGCTNLEYINIPNSLRFIGQNVFYGCNKLTIYSECNSKQSEWHDRFNSSFRPVFFSVIFDENNYIESILISDETVINKNAIGGISKPIYAGKEFVNWFDDNSNIYNIEDIPNIDSDIKLYASYGEM